ncbi:MAG: HEAT repeat domain-containing protein [Desulfobacterales bacterium]|nr:HEAT repeat domain-containing protein [Desulfobacterales bacterium]
MNKPLAKTKFDPRLKLFGHSLFEIHTDISREVYLDTVKEIMGYLGLSDYSNGLILAEADKESNLLKYLLKYYTKQTEPFPIEEQIAYPNKIYKYANEILTNSNRYYLWKNVSIFISNSENQVTPQIISDLTNSLEDDNPEVRKSAAFALGCLGQYDVISALITKLEDDYFPIRISAASTIGNLGQHSKKIIFALINVLHSYNPEVRCSAASALGNLGQYDEDVISALIKAHKDTFSSVRVSAASALGHLGYYDKNIISTLTSALRSHYSFSIRASAASALGNLKQYDDNVTSALIRTVLKDNSLSVRASAASALGNSEPHDDNITFALTNALRDNAFSVRASAASALGNVDWHDEKVIPALINALKDDSSIVRVLTASALVNLGHYDEKLIFPLINALKDDSWHIKSTSAATISRIFFLDNYSIIKTRDYITDRKRLHNLLFYIYNFFSDKLHFFWLKDKFYAAKNRYFYIPKDKIVRHILEHAAASKNLQQIYDTPNAIRIITESFMDEDDPDSIYYSLLFFNIKKIKMPIAVSLLKELVNPDKDERTKLAIFQLLMKVELVDEKGNTVCS